MTELELTSFLFQLADHGVTGIKVKYDGGGDSGAIEWIGYTTKPCNEFDDIANNIDDWADDQKLSTLDSGAYSLIEEFAQETILDDIEDWWNNEGGWGELLILVPSGKYHVINNVRITDHETYEHEGDLLSKSEE
jgi:hypothetical protein